jgi:hypothetical protein
VLILHREYVLPQQPYCDRPQQYCRPSTADVKPRREAASKYNPPAAHHDGWAPAGYWRNETYIPLPGPGYYDRIPDEALAALACLQACVEVWEGTVMHRVPLPHGMSMIGPRSKSEMAHAASSWPPEKDTERPQWPNHFAGLLCSYCFHGRFHTAATGQSSIINQRRSSDVWEPHGQ